MALTINVRRDSDHFTWTHHFKIISSHPHRTIQQVVCSVDDEVFQSRSLFQHKIIILHITKKSFSKRMMKLCLPLAILLLGVGSIVANRDCNEQFATVSSPEIKAILDFLIDGIVSVGDDLATTRQVVTPLVQHDVIAIKLCLKCSDVGAQDLMEEALLDNSWYGFATYCSMNQYGWNATHSALMFAPVDSNGVILSGQLRGFVAGHDTAINVDMGPTESWPDDVSTLLGDASLTNTEKISTLQPYVSCLAAATAGAVAILPDYIGYGESKNFDRAFLYPRMYMQAAGLSFAAARRFVSRIGQDCATLADIATVTGYGEGGYFAIVGALALERSGVVIISCRPGATPFELDVQLGFATRTTEPSTPLQLFLSFFGYGYSNDFTFMDNTESEQKALHPTWMNQSNPDMNVLSWFKSPKSLEATEVISLLPTGNIQGMFNPAMVAMYEESVFEGSFSACRDGIYVTDPVRSLCDTILLAGLWNTLSFDVTFPVSICHSPYDDVIGFENVPNPTYLPSNIKIYSSAIGDLNPRGGHFESYFLCSLDPISYIANTPSGPTSPVWRELLDTLPLQCIVDAPMAESPVEAPVSEPSCSLIYESCEDSSQSCCSGLQCIHRAVVGGVEFVCSPQGRRNGNRQSIAGEGVGGSVRGKEKEQGSLGS
jgi:hypothetical protein